MWAPGQSEELSSLLRIVNLVRLGEAVTRPELSRATGLGRGVVAQRVERAMTVGYLEDGEFAESSGGRQPRMLRFTSERGLLVQCALGALHIHVGVSALSGGMLAHSHREWDIARGPAATMETAMAMIDDLLSSADAPIWGIGVGVPGPVNFATGCPVAPPIMPGWNGFEVRRRFEQRYGAPTWVDNDVNLLAFTERERRRDSAPDLIYCKVGTGIGAGLLSQGRIHRGAQGAAGDIGHERVHESDVLCRCGKVGCLEAVAGGWALVRDAQAAVDDGVETVLSGGLRDGVPLTPEIIAKAAQDGDVLAISLVRRSARLVGEALASLVNMFNPGVIVVGGAVAAGAGEIFIADIRQRIYELSHPLATSELKIARSVDDIREPLRGCAEMVREQLFDVTFGRWFDDGRPTSSAIWAPAA